MLTSAVLAVGLLSALSAVAADTQPNVVVMLADNMGYSDLGAYGSGGELRGMPTPRIDKLAGEGRGCPSSLRSRAARRRARR